MAVSKILCLPENAVLSAIPNNNRWVAFYLVFFSRFSTIWSKAWGKDSQRE